MSREIRKDDMARLHRRLRRGAGRRRSQSARTAELRANNKVSHLRRTHVGNQRTGVQLPPFARRDHLAEVDLEHARWSEIVALIHLLTRHERVVPGGAT